MRQTMKITAAIAFVLFSTAGAFGGEGIPDWWCSSSLCAWGEVLKGIVNRIGGYIWNSISSCTPTLGDNFTRSVRKRRQNDSPENDFHKIAAKESISFPHNMHAATNRPQPLFWASISLNEINANSMHKEATKHLVVDMHFGANGTSEYPIKIENRQSGSVVTLEIRYEKTR